MEPRHVLADKEEIHYQSKKHWAVLIKAAIYFGLAALILTSKDFIHKSLSTHLPYVQCEDTRNASASSKAKPQTSQDKPGVSSPKDPQTQDDFKQLICNVVTWTVAGVCFTAAVVFALMGMARLLSFFSNKVLITQKRLIQHDVLSGSLSSLDLAHIESVRACTGLLGSLLGYGRLILVMGSGQKISIANLRRPHEFERELFSAK